MEDLTEYEILTLAWITKKINADFIVYKLEIDSSLKQVRKKALLDIIEITNENNDGLLEATFLSNFEEVDFQWSDVLNPFFFEDSIQKYLAKLQGFLSIK